MAEDIEYTVIFQKGRVVGARSTRMEHVQAVTPSQAIAKARLLFQDAKAKGYRVVCVDHFDEEGHRVIDEEF